jgi:lipid II:glycine glycyltransferase (peptidoglycan interpeptide bridge formation enzyme)
VRDEEAILKDMRSTARNLIRRAQKEGVTVEHSADPVADLKYFLALHEETRKRHGFTPYSTAFFQAQVSRFAPRNECSLYLAHYQGEVIASSIHMHGGGETSYHHGASTQKYRNIPASYLLQWTAISDALKRRDRIYNFWGISPEGVTKHPFAGVRTFKTAFGGRLLDLVHCMDIPLSKKYLITLGIESVRKWRRGF